MSNPQSLELKLDPEFDFELEVKLKVSNSGVEAPRHIICT